MPFCCDRSARRSPALHPLLLLTLLVVGLLVPATSARADLEADVQRALRTIDLRKAKASISVRNADTNASIIAIDAERPLLPASNMKLFTTGAFLHAFGKDFAFRTRMMRAHDDLVILGDGDPAFGDPDLLAEMTYTDEKGVERKGLDVETLLSMWVKALKDDQITAIDELVVDGRIFDSVAFHPNWPKDQYKEDYCAEVWGFNFHHNLLHVWPRPRSGGSADVSRIAPEAPWIIRENNTRSRTGSQDRHTFWINRPPSQNAITFNGNVKVAAVDPIPVTLHDNPGFFAKLFAERLRAAGITVRSFRAATPEDPSYLEGNAVGPEVRTPIVTVLYRCNTDSDNLYAECLLKRLGRAASKAPGSWANGTAALRHAIAERIANPALSAPFAPDDGSGLSRENRVTASLVTAWLNSFHRDSELGQAFKDSLAVGGQSGTVKKRFKDIERTGCVVQCKTGYIRGVSCLSGFVTAPDGRCMSFSVLCNELVEGDAVSKARALQEKIVTAIAEDLISSGGKRDPLGGG
ncbi:MAG: D-alanyl-D-alanine carboxypeptidase/D-alanyl-D-alanine-endopeptidase [Phycisphaerae bacterium]|jgi:D-alanyl-D-alanine carboxypeptidase/D-alanyl-D-alanine-endopeptidase (penicillin-binding protein 4)|nr:D-alanyl-D-alanine carboxypeptidase/D-alanyl-D-alanine-endopeptidase [Phycisphaerae bacterium]